MNGSSTTSNNKRKREDVAAPEVRITRALEKRMSEAASMRCFTIGCEFWGLKENNFKCSEHCGLYVRPPRVELMTEDSIRRWLIENALFGNLITFATKEWFGMMMHIIKKQKTYKDAATAFVKQVHSAWEDGNGGGLRVSIFSFEQTVALMNLAKMQCEGRGETSNEKRLLSDLLTRFCAEPWRLLFNGSPILASSVCYFGNFGHSPAAVHDNYLHFLTQWKNMHLDASGVRWYNDTINVQ